VLLDAGSGVCRLVEHPELLRGVERLDIVLTHFHLDHVVGLAFLPALSGEMERRLWGPGARNYGRPTRAVLEAMVAPPFFGGGLEACVDAVDDVPPDRLELPRHTIWHRTQPRHSDPTLGLRLGDDLAYCTDTAADPDTAAFAQGARVLAHDAWSSSSAPHETAIHATGREAADIATAAGARELVLIHLDPREDHDGLLADASAFPATRLGRDLAQLA
jgi:ribonuclease BN (tRNA processing enzyme)